MTAVGHCLILDKRVSGYPDKQRRLFIMKKIATWLVFLLVAMTSTMVLTGMLIPASPAYASGGTDPFASTAVANAPATLGATSTGALGKALFYGALFVGIITILFTKHRLYGLIAIVFGFLVGAYTGIAQGLWTAVGGH